MAPSSLARASYLGLDLGERRIGVAYAADGVASAVPLTTLIVDGSERANLKQLIDERQVTDVVIGRPRNQSGQTTMQTSQIEAMASQLLNGYHGEVHFQDESLTSVQAEQELMRRGKPYEKAEIDRLAASLILQDFLSSQQV